MQVAAVVAFTFSLISRPERLPWLVPQRFSLSLSIARGNGRPDHSI
jgi:hypothetical protein